MRQIHVPDEGGFLVVEEEDAVSTMRTYGGARCRVSLSQASCTASIVGLSGSVQKEI